MKTVIGLTALCLASAGIGTSAQAQTPAELAVKSGCAICHQADKKLVGPSYRDIAAKNKGKADAAARLQASVRKGSKDVWGPVMMPQADPKKLSDADLKVLIAWILKTP